MKTAKAIALNTGAKLAFTTVYGKIDSSMGLLHLPRIRVRGEETIEQFAEVVSLKNNHYVASM